MKVCKINYNPRFMISNHFFHSVKVTFWSRFFFFFIYRVFLKSGYDWRIRVENNFSPIKIKITYFIIQMLRILLPSITYREFQGQGFGFFVYLNWRRKWWRKINFFHIWLHFLIKLIAKFERTISSRICLVQLTYFAIPVYVYKQCQNH